MLRSSLLKIFTKKLIINCKLFIKKKQSWCPLAKPHRFVKDSQRIKRRSYKVLLITSSNSIKDRGSASMGLKTCNLYWLLSPNELFFKDSQLMAVTSPNNPTSFPRSENLLNIFCRFPSQKTLKPTFPVS